jgi:hypothetical protein
MTRTSPTFFKIPVTAELDRGIHYPANPTIVLTHFPDLSRPELRLSEGMKPLDNRRAILQCYEAFKRFIIQGAPSCPSIPTSTILTIAHSV